MVLRLNNWKLGLSWKPWIEAAYLHIRYICCFYSIEFTGSGEFQGCSCIHFNKKKYEKLIHLEIGTQLKALRLRPPTCTLGVFTVCGCCECSWWQREGADDKRIIREDKRIMETSNVPPLSHRVGVQSHAALTICFVLLYFVIGETIISNKSILQKFYKWALLFFLFLSLFYGSVEAIGSSIRK